VRHSKDRSSSISSLGLLVVLTVTTLAAQQTSSPPPQPPPPQPRATSDDQPPPRFRTDANYVRVDVYPTKDGKVVDDLKAEDFELLENGAKQEVRAFEHVIASPAGPQSMRVEASSVRGGEQMAANPRNRVFVIFLDMPNVDVESAHHVNQPLVRLIDRLLGPDDLIAVMTPEMSAAQITFGRKTEVIAGMLSARWYWGTRNLPQDDTEREREYEACFGPSEQERKSGQPTSSIARQMNLRRRERATLDSLRDLVRYLGSVREERKAILTVTQGWVLYRPDESMNRLRVMDRYGNTEPVPGNEPVGVDQFGKLRVGGGRDQDGNPASQTICDKDRMYLASLDNELYFREILDVANRNNASFYPIDPRGLAAFDSPIGPALPPPLWIDRAMLKQRVEVLRTLAENTDGVAVVETNDLDRGMRRIADDLSSYYLLGYYSTNTKLDGQFRRITVRVRRPGVDVRARRGYRAATADEVNASRLAAAVPVPDATKAAAAALGKLGRIRPEQRFVIHASPVRQSQTGPVTGVWVAGELQGPMEEFGAGAQATIELAAGTAVGRSTVALKQGERAFLVRIPVEGAATGDLDVRARLTPSGGGSAIADAAKLDLDPALAQPLLFRRGLSTGNRLQPAAGFQFSRTDRLHLELPIATAAPGTGRLLDRNAQPLQIPVQVGEKTDADGQRWLTADATLSALAAGDYVLEVTLSAEGTERRVLTGIRVTR
jgi:VWFA-related protein